MALKPVLRGGTYYAFGTVAGRRVRKSLGTSNEKEAREICTIWEARERQRQVYGEQAVRTFEEAAASYVDSGGEHRFLKPLVNRFGSRLVGSIKPGEIQAAVRAVYPNASNATRNRQVIVPARAVINHAAGLGWCSPVKVERFREQKAKRTSVGREWVNAFMAQADADGLPHLSAAVLFMHQTGTRIGEAARILPEHVSLEDRIILLERTKTGEWEKRHITRELADRITKLEQAPGKPLFGYADRWGVTNRMKAVCRRAGIPYLPSHQVGRHSFATNAFAMGATVAEVKEAGGWKTSRLLLETYAHAEHAGRSIADRFDAIKTQPTLAAA